MAFALALVLAVTGPFTIHGDRRVGPIRIRSTTFSQARTVLGPPEVVRRRRDTCGVRWPGLYVSFLEFGGNACRTGSAVYAVVRGTRWHTDRGLRVGDRESRLQALYPRAKAHSDGWWLITRHACKAVGGQPFPGLKARIGRRRITAFVVSASVCD